MSSILDHQYKAEEVAYLDCKAKIRSQFLGAVFWGLLFSIMLGFMALAAMAIAELRWSLEFVLSIAAIPTVLGFYWTFRSSKPLYKDLKAERVDIYEAPVVKKYMRRGSKNSVRCYLIFGQQPTPDKGNLVSEHRYQEVEVGQLVESYFGSHSKEFISFKKIKAPQEKPKNQDAPMQRSSTSPPSPEDIHEEQQKTEKKDGFWAILVKSMLISIVSMIVVLSLMLIPIQVFGLLGGDWLGVTGGLVTFVALLWLIKIAWEKVGKEKLMIKK